MEDPVSEIPTVIQHLTQSPPALQSQTIDQFFTPNASFVHPFCRVQHFRGSRWVIRKIYQWYKVMSPRIEMNIHSVAYDPKTLTLYVTMSQIFTIWIVPFHVAPVKMTIVLDLTTDPSGNSITSSSRTKSNSNHQGKETASYADVVANGPDGDLKVTNGHRKLYYIAKQEDLYQTSEFIKFVLPHVGHWIILAVHLFATVFCVLGAILFWPFMWMEEQGWIPGVVLRGGNIVYDIGWKKGDIGKET
ncbi:hypothetical protein BDV23DRAFT_149263 [Aspergillus alliaceus]|uniref:SigF-like NTF2-like domain-containing protein n=1 Tax=Petromyces alliaceus TaxID=209559 RepID=A0A5N7CH16_PETAA|nr:hypothetical protein BDV23DRAFT_149263 [Aspergillus alliaceus]